MGKRHFLQLAHVANVNKHTVAGQFLSEKLDGMRFLWDGGVSRGVPVEKVPWSNTLKSNLVPKATGLWSRYGKVINAPDWWLDFLPPQIPLDGELWTDRGSFQSISSIVRSAVNPKDWTGVKAMVLDVPNPVRLFADGEVSEPNFTKKFKGCYDFYIKNGGSLPFSEGTAFMSRYNWLQKRVVENEVVKIHKQERLPTKQSAAIERVYEFTDNLLMQGGEGSIVKSQASLWIPERCYTVLKFKPYNDGEATVIGYRTGRETDKGSKLLGLMGSLICKINAGTFKVSGFTDGERYLAYLDGPSAKEWAENHPDAEVPSLIHNPRFPRGSVVTYKYRELTYDGLPKEGRYWRKA